ncbi:SCO family protein [uncultured Ruegeria sp.]|uniref:SCO family protein n=1 Tax=uncultured Ruegeria sp. TaxID=259304 RepID=UPI0026371F6C|nr:SCO family protein [uncultured Ruegeria sp.]
MDDQHVLGARQSAHSGETAAQALVSFVDRVKQGQCVSVDLVEYLTVDHPIYREQPAATVARLRAYVIAAFHDAGMPQSAAPFVAEVLETSIDANLTAAAARALNGSATLSPVWADHLVNAIYNIWRNDQPICFDSYQLFWPLLCYSTALGEILHRLEAMGPDARHVVPRLKKLLSDTPGQFHPENRAAIRRCIDALAAARTSCCSHSGPLNFETPMTSADLMDLSAVELQDQDGRDLTWEQYFTGAPSLIAFFYTTCMNPKKCVQTIYNLDRTHRSLVKQYLGDQVRVAAITYDSTRDTPEMLRQYGLSKGIRFGKNYRFFRIPTDFPKIASAFRLGVNFASGQVNDHQIEVYLLDRKGRLVQKFLRFQARPAAIVSSLTDLVP